MENRLRYLAKNTYILAIGEFGTKLINFFLVPFYTHVLTTEQYGTVDLIFTICTVIVPLVMFNIGEAIMRFALDDDADYGKLFSIALLAILFGCAISLGIIPLTSTMAILAQYSKYIYFYIVLCATKSVLTSFLRGREQLKIYVSCNLLNSFLIAVFNILFLVYFQWGIEGYLTAYILAEACAVFFAFIFGKMYTYIVHFSFDWLLTKKMILFSLAVVPNSLLWWIMNSSDRVMVTALCDVSENGILAVAYKLPSLLTVVNTILMQAWKYSAIKEKNSSDRDEFNNMMLKNFLRGSVLIAATMILVIKIFTNLLFAEAYYLSWKSSVYLLLGFVFMGLGTFVGTIYYVEKNMVGNMLSAFVGAAANLLLNYLLIPFMGAEGATFAACISYFIILMYRYFDTRKYQKLNLLSIENLILLVIMILMVISNLMDNNVGNILLVLSYAACLFVNKTYILTIVKKSVSLIRNLMK